MDRDIPSRKFESAALAFRMREDEYQIEVGSLEIHSHQQDPIVSWWPKVPALHQHFLKNEINFSLTLEGKVTN